MKTYGNRQKHLNINPLQRFLLNKFKVRIGELINQTQAGKILDVGCGEGFIINYLRKNGLSHTFIAGGDMSLTALLWGRERLAHRAPLIQLDVHQLPFAENSFPLLLCLEVLEHLPDSVLGVRELARVTSEYLLLSVPHEPFFRGANFLRGRQLGTWGRDPEHLHVYSSADFRRIVSQVVDIVWHGYSFPWQIVLARKRS